MDEKTLHRRHRLAIFRKKARVERKYGGNIYTQHRFVKSGIMKRYGVVFCSDKTWLTRNIRRTKGYKQSVAAIINDGLSIYERGE